MKSVSILALAPCVLAVPEQPSFADWAGSYVTNGDDVRATYEANVMEINRLNSLNTTAVFGVNQFSGMTSEEFVATMGGEIEDDSSNSSLPVVDHVLEDSAMAGSIDWVQKGGVTPVKDQGRCGSCWAFCAMGVIEAVHKVQTGETVILAEEQLVDCYGAGTCHGAGTSVAMKWLKSHTPCTEESYPYSDSARISGEGGSCKSCSSSHIQVKEVNIIKKTDGALASALNKSPVAVKLDSSMLHHYSSGVLEGGTSCKINHAVLAVGYASNYWKIKNSWGEGWGEHGYVRIQRGAGGCGNFGILYTYPSVPTLSSSPSPSPSPHPSPSPTPQPSPPGGSTWYKTITPSSNTGLCLDLPGGDTTPGTGLWLWECNGAESQRWVFDAYQIRFGADESKCVDAGDMSNGHTAVLWDCNGYPQQDWSYDSDASRIYLSNTITCMDFFADQQWNGQPVHTWECNGEGNQEWGLWNVNSNSAGTAASVSEAFII